MTTTSYPSDKTGVLLVDPYNDFLSEESKLWPLVKLIAEEQRLLDSGRSLRARIASVVMSNVIRAGNRTLNRRYP